LKLAMEGVLNKEREYSVMRKKHEQGSKLVEELRNMHKK
jgi:hypothetical protein